MDNLKNNIEDFELLLREQSVKKPLFLYNKDLQPSEQTYKPQDVIKSVYSQVKAYQLADCGSSGISGCKAVNIAKKSDLSTINKVSKVNPYKFDTQCVLDTQIMDIIDGAAVKDTNTGMTQEFDTTFTHTDDINSENLEHNTEVNNLVQGHINSGTINNSVSSLNEDSIVAAQSSQISKEIDNDTEMQQDSEQIAVQNLEDSIGMDTKQNSQLFKTATADTMTFIESFATTQEEEQEQDVNEEVEEIINDSQEMDTDETICLTQSDIDTGQDIELSPSPVLHMKTNRKLKTPIPLVVSLEAFENFENVAMSLIDETDFETAKHLINSQILEKELCFNEHAEVLLEMEREDSPILDFKSDELKISSKELMPPKKEVDVVLFQDIENVTKKRSDILEDEILFSSDEEDFADNQFQNLPPTCVLETCSPLNETGILEKSMFVGFQTASNKSIQISRNSFEQAQSILSDDSGKADKELSLNELVEKCDKLRRTEETMPKTESLEIRDMKLKSLSDNKTLEEQIYLNNNEIEEIKVSKSFQDTKVSAHKKEHFDGFTTASNKKIVMSDVALQKCQNIFKDIDLNDDSNILKKSKLTDATDMECRIDKLENVVDKTRNIEVNTDDKINDELLLQEFENIEMSLEEKESKDKEHVANEDFEAVTRNNTILEETTKSKNMDSPEFIGFKTANNKGIKISEEALAKTKDIFKDIGKDKHKMKSFEDVMSQPSTSKMMFVGFKTASNKNINISNNALSKSKNIFKDIDKEQPITSTSKCENQTATSKAIMSNTHKTPTEKSKGILSKSKFCNDIAEDMFVFSEFEEPEPAFRGFDIPSSKKVDVSNKFTKNIHNEDKAIVEADSIVPKNTPKIPTDISENNINEVPDIGPKVFSNEIQFSSNRGKDDNFLFKGFETASKKPVTVSADALARSKRIFEDIRQANDMVPKKSPKNLANTLNNNISKISGIVPANFDDKINICNNDKKDDNTLCKGFQTASKKPVTISANALAKSKRMFQDIDKANDIVPNEIPENTSKITAETPVSNSTIQLCNDEGKGVNFLFKGFETASKKPVTVSADALSKGKSIFKDIDETIDKNKDIESVRFQTANKNPVEVNKDALIASKKFLNDLSDGFNNDKHGNVFVGFNTASNKKVNITDEALARCKQIFDDIEDIPIAHTKLDSNIDMFKGFQTANKKKVEVSKQALIKSKIIFDDINHFSVKDTQKSFGFQTANNEKVIVSEQSLAKSKQLLQDIDCENNINTAKVTEKSITKDNFGFKAGSNKDVRVSDDAFAITKNVFAEKDIKKSTVNKNIELTKDFETNKDTVHLDNILDTQVMNDFKEDMCTEDFSCKPIKRSGSPILMCPKAKKKRKFETPYTNKLKITEENNVYKNPVAKKPTNVTFRDDYKKNKKYALRDLTDFEKDKIKNIDPYILNFSLENMINFEFDESRNDFKDGKMNIDDVKHLFIDATDAKLIPDGWLDIHLKLIIWKLISYEIKFPNTLEKVCTVKNVIDQLKYRYDKELYNAERPVLRKILEKDDVPNKTMVLCVAAIFVDGVSVISATNLNNIELLLTDGWYFIKAAIDNMLSKLVYDGKIVVGSKIVTCGAELLNCEQGVAPWEDISSIRLSISGNSTRPARWHEKLGLRPCSMLSQLSAVRLGGGKVARLRVRVVRVYPRLYVEKFQDGSTVTRSERLEQQYQTRYEAEREAMIEKIYEEVEKEMSDQDSQDSESLSEKRKCCDSGSQIAKMMKTSKDPMEFRAQLNSSQIHLLQEHVSKQRDRYVQAIQDRVQERLHARNVVTLARGRVVGLERDGDGVTVTKGMLSIWKPNEEVLDIFREGSWIEVTNVVPTALRNSEIQLSAGRQSLFRPVKCKEDDFKPYIVSLSRTCFSIKDLSQNPSMTTEYNEIDTVGMIFEIDPSNQDFDSNKNQFQNVFLADPDKNMIAVNFWGGIKKFGYDNILDTGQVVYCCNLQKRAGNTRKNIPQFRATEFAIFTKSPRNEMGRDLVEEMNKKMFGLDRRRFCEDCMAVKQNYSVIKCLNDSENVSPYRFNKSDYNLARNKVFIETPVVKVRSKAEEFNLTGLDFESTFKQQDTQLSPKSMERKKKVNEKIAKLKMYGEPPPLCPMNIINKSKNATSSYRSPLLKGEEMSNNVSAASVNKLQSATTPIKLIDDSVQIDDECLVSSPIISNISMNRTFVKRNINPMKLSFSENVTEENVNRTVDHFAEDFDGSPPLSLE